MEPRGQNSHHSCALASHGPSPPTSCWDRLSSSQPSPRKRLYEATILMSSARERVDPVERMSASALMGIHGRWDKGLSEWTSRVQKGELESPRQPEGMGHLAWPPRASLPREEKAAGGFEHSESAFFRFSPKNPWETLSPPDKDGTPPCETHQQHLRSSPALKPRKQPLAPARVETTTQGSPRTTQGHAGGGFGEPCASW